MPCAKSLLTVPILALLSLSSTACSTSGSGATVVPRQVPGAPSYMVPVQVKAPELGEDPYAVAARERAGRLQANRIIVKGAAEWNTIAAELSTP